MSKPVLFYSRFCTHSTAAVRAVAARDLVGAFAMACIDGNRHLIPAWVDRVPVLFTPDHRLLADDELLAYVASFVSRPGGGGAFSTAAAAVVDPIAAEARGASRYGGTAYSTFLQERPGSGSGGDSAQGGDCGVAGSFYLSIDNVGNEDFPRIDTPPDDSLRSSSSPSGNMQQQQMQQQQMQQQQQQQYNPHQFANPQQQAGAVPGRGMVAVVAGGGGNGQPPPRIMPVMTGNGGNNNGGGGGSLMGFGQQQWGDKSSASASVMDSLVAAREQDEAQWRHAGGRT